MERLRAAPVRAQMRYVGPADTLWRLSTVEIIDIRGDLAVSANIGGTGANPVIEGALMTRSATLESPVTGMRLTDLHTLARFNGSRLVFTRIDARSGKAGTVTGRGSLDFSLGQGVGIDLRLQADKAEMLNRDDIGATVTGAGYDPLRRPGRCYRRRPRRRQQSLHHGQGGDGGADPRTRDHRKEPAARRFRDLRPRRRTGGRISPRGRASG